MNNNAVEPKVTAATLGGAVAVIAVWIEGLLGLDVPPEVAAAEATVFAFVFGWAR